MKELIGHPILLYVSSYYYMCPHTTMCVSEFYCVSYCYVCVLILVPLQLSLLDSGVNELLRHPIPLRLYM